MQLFSNRMFRTIAVPLALVSCVAINVYFPAAAAEKAADRIIEDVWGKQPGAATPAPDAPAASAAPKKSSYYPVSARQFKMASLLDSVISPAGAAEADINIATPAIDKLRASLKTRFAQLAPLYSSGIVGLTRNALVAERDPSATPLKDRNTVKQLVGAENTDRDALYREIAQANNHAEWEQDIRGTFAKQWVEKARAGWWYQAASGAWAQK